MNQASPETYQTRVEEILVAGTVYSDEGVSPAGSGVPIAVSVYGGTTSGTDFFTTTTDSAGQYGVTISTANLSAGDRLMAYVNTGTGRGATVTVSDGGLIDDFDVYQGRVIVRHDNGGNPSAADLIAAHNTDTDIPYASGTGTTENGFILLVPSGTTFAPTANLAVGTAGTSSTLRILGTLTMAASTTLTVYGSVTGAGILDASAAGTTVTIGGSLSVGTYLATAGTTSVGGNFTPTSFTHNSGTVAFTGTGSVGSYTFSTMTVSGGTRTATGNLVIAAGLSLSGGTFAREGDPPVAGNWNDTAVSFTPAAGTIVLTGSAPTITTGGSNSFNNLTVTNGATLGSAVVVSNNLTVQGGALDVSASNYGITVGGNWTMSGSFTPRNGTVTFNTAAKESAVSGATTFYNLAITTPGKAVAFEAGKEQTVTNGLTITGTASGYVRLKSLSAGTQWKLRLSGGTQSVTYAYPEDSYAGDGNTISASNSLSGGNNTNWNFTAGGTNVAWEGDVSTSWSDGGNWSSGAVPEPPRRSRSPREPVRASPRVKRDHRLPRHRRRRGPDPVRNGCPYDH